jgi:hypothetical protein
MTIVLTPNARRWNVVINLSLTSLVVGLHYATEPGLDSFDVVLPFVSFTFEYIHESHRDKFCICEHGIVRRNPLCKVPHKENEQ